MPKLKHVLCSHVTLANLRVCVYKRPGVKFGQGREQNTFPGAGDVAGNYRPGSPYLAGAGNGDKPSPGAGNSRRLESRLFPGIHDTASRSIFGIIRYS